jgi:protein HOOK3
VEKFYDFYQYLPILFCREKILRLEHENKMLKLKSSGDNDEQSQVLQTMLDDANSRKNELETEIR